jgi:hypothetical protein
MDGSMQDFRPSDGDQDRAENRAAALTPREALLVFTAGWLGGAGLLTAFSPVADLGTRLLAAAQMIAAVLWFAPRMRMSGFGASLAVLAIVALRQLVTGRPPGAAVFYAAVVVFLAVTERAARVE